MSEHNKLALLLDTVDPCSPLQEQLSNRPPLTMRAEPIITERRRLEAWFRPKSARPKDEDALIGTGRAAGMYLLKCFLKVTGLYERGRQNALRPILSEHSFVFPDLPEDLDGFRILQISDPHIPRRSPELAERARRLLQGLEADVCALTGDYCYGYFGPTDHVAPSLLHILSGVTLRFGYIGIMGNHDTTILGESLESAGIPMLYNEGVLFAVGDARVWIGGIDDPHNFRCDRIDHALAGAPPSAFVILLAHTPERIREAAERGVHLYVCGHTHGGQIRLPGIGAVTDNTRCSRSQTVGPWRFKNMAGYTSAGLGATDLPVRYRCPPEAVLITLRRGCPA